MKLGKNSLYLLLITLISVQKIESQRSKAYSDTITIIGTGYVGLVTGAVLSSFGHNVICCDIDKEKIESLQKGEIPYYEPGLPELVHAGILNNTLAFTTNVADAIQQAKKVMIAVGTPYDYEKKQINLNAVLNVTQKIAENLNGYKIICIKSTVPIGTHKKVAAILNQKTKNKGKFAIVSNPEFLREGTAIKDFLTVNPIVLGSDCQKALYKMHKIYQPLFKRNKIKVIITNSTTAEAIKYAWNSFSATRIGYVNDLVDLCDKTGVNINHIVQAISLSELLLPTENLKPGPGIGGSCLPKDVKALIDMAKENGSQVPIIEGVLNANQQHKKRIVQKIRKLLDEAKGKTVCILGLSFKKNTDDIRETPAIYILQELQKNNITIKAYDPHAMQNMQMLIPNINYCTSMHEALKDADLTVILTDWDEFKRMHLPTAKTLMHQPIIFDTRNMWHPQEIEDLGFQYFNLGRRE
jgi:UDPglucose 6-dehydrogenase